MAPRLVPGLEVRVGGTVAGRYRVEALIGSGPLGIVLAARHIHLRESVVLKIFASYTDAQAAAVEHAIQRARIASRLVSRHVARIVDIGLTEDGMPFVATEHPEGFTLAAELERRGRMSADEAIRWILEACVALAEAHGQGLVHGDLKPQNLFLAFVRDRAGGIVNPSARSGDADAGAGNGATAGAALRSPPDTPRSSDLTRVTAAKVPRGVDGRGESTAGPQRFLKILDFGATSPVEALSDQSASAFFASPAFLAPEQIKDPAAVDERVDIWALGILLFTMVSGKLPFTADTLSGAMVAVVYDAAPLLADAEYDVARVVQRCLEKDPGERPRNVVELAAALAPHAGADGPRLLELVRTTAEMSRSAGAAARASGPSSRGSSDADGSSDAVRRSAPLAELTAQDNDDYADGLDARTSTESVPAISFSIGSDRASRPEIRPEGRPEVWYGVLRRSESRLSASQRDDASRPERADRGKGPSIRSWHPRPGARAKRSVGGQQEHGILASLVAHAKRLGALRRIMRAGESDRGGVSDERATSDGRALDQRNDAARNDATRPSKRVRAERRRAASKFSALGVLAAVGGLALGTLATTVVDQTPSLTVSPQQPRVRPQALSLQASHAPRVARSTTDHAGTTDGLERASDTFAAGPDKPLAPTPLATPPVATEPSPHALPSTNASPTQPTLATLRAAAQSPTPTRNDRTPRALPTSQALPSPRALPAPRALPTPPTPHDIPPASVRTSEAPRATGRASSTPLKSNTSTGGASNGTATLVASGTSTASRLPPGLPSARRPAPASQVDPRPAPSTATPRASAAPPRSNQLDPTYLRSILGER